MNNAEFRKWLIKRKACRDALDWLGDRTSEQAWDACERADWLFWWAARAGTPTAQIILAACACARTALKYVPAGEEQPRLAIEAAEVWARDPSPENQEKLKTAWLSSRPATSEVWRKAEVVSEAASWAPWKDVTSAERAGRMATAVVSWLAGSAWAEAVEWEASDARDNAHREMCGLIREIIRYPFEK